MDKKFKIVSPFKPAGDQPMAIEELAKGILEGKKNQVMLGVTGSGKTFTIANVICSVQRPALIIAHNKTLAAQLYEEFKGLFPENAVEYFVSYYDYYQPEAYLPTTDTYIEKDSAINEEIDKMRHSATHSLLTRRDVIIVASVSCIYGLGSPDAYLEMIVQLEVGKDFPRDELLRKLVEIQYERNDIDFHRGTFRVRGDVVEIFPPYEDEQALRIEFFGDTIESMILIDPLRGKKISTVNKTAVYPGSHYVTTRENLKRAMADIRAELALTLAEYKEQNKLLEMQRLEQRTNFDLEMMEEMFPSEVRWTRPQGGMFLWGILPEYMDAAEVLKVALQHKVAFVPGESFHPNGGGKNTMRLNFSYSNPDTIREGITRMGTVLKELVRKQA